jgi:hypothetical protein
MMKDRQSKIDGPSFFFVIDYTKTIAHFGNLRMASQVDQSPLMHTILAQYGDIRLKPFLSFAEGWSMTVMVCLSRMPHKARKGAYNGIRIRMLN